MKILKMRFENCAIRAQLSSQLTLKSPACLTKPSSLASLSWCPHPQQLALFLLPRLPLSRLKAQFDLSSVFGAAVHWWGKTDIQLSTVHMRLGALYTPDGGGGGGIRNSQLSFNPIYVQSRDACIYSLGFLRSQILSQNLFYRQDVPMPKSS